jgi:hypothetical protein
MINTNRLELRKELGHSITKAETPKKAIAKKIQKKDFIYNL